MDDTLARFLRRPVMIIVGTLDRARRPEIGRAVGATPDLAENRVDLLVSEWQWPATVANVRATGRAAATFSRPSDYETYQIKGRATLRPTGPADIDAARTYRRETIVALTEVGLDPALAEHWLTDRDLVLLSLTAEDVFVQTPGPRAGLRLEGGA